MDRQQFLDDVIKAIGQENLSPVYLRHRTTFLRKRLAALPAGELVRLKTMPWDQLEGLLVTNTNEGSTARAQQVSHVRWLARFLGSPGSARPGRSLGETIAVPVADGLVRVSGLRRRLSRADVDRIIRAVRLWQK